MIEMTLSLELIDTFWGFFLSSFLIRFSSFPCFSSFSPFNSISLGSLLLFLVFHLFLLLTPYFLVVCYFSLFQSLKLLLLKRSFERVTSVQSYLQIQIQINKPGGNFFKFTKKPSEHTTDVILLSKLFSCFDQALVKLISFYSKVNLFHESSCKWN